MGFLRGLEHRAGAAAMPPQTLLCYVLPGLIGTSSMEHLTNEFPHSPEVTSGVSLSTQAEMTGHRNRIAGVDCLAALVQLRAEVSFQRAAVGNAIVHTNLG